MALDLEEQEQLETLKAWWSDHGKLVVTIAIVSALAVSAFQGWRYYSAQQAERAATLYIQLGEAERTNDAKRVRDIASQIIARHASTQYAGMAALTAAKAGVATGEVEEAKKNLQWVVDHAKEAQMRDVARLRLAGVLLDEKKYDEALKLLANQPADSYAMLYADMRGDVLTAQQKTAEARAAYQLALDKSDATSSYRRLIEVKLDALGEGK
jgi:predicted negative regulator of RcsB-dependent stress response